MHALIRELCKNEEACQWCAVPPSLESITKMEYNTEVNLLIIIIPMSPTETPPHANKTAPKDVFLYLLAIGTLYTSAVSLIALMFQYVNRLIPDILPGEDLGIRQTIRWSLSSLIVVFPVFAWLWSKLQHDVLEAPEKREMPIRKWLVNLTLFVAAITIIVDLVSLIYNYLGGELTTRFLLKILAVLVVAVIVFTYFIWDLRRQAPEIPKKMRLLAIASMVIVAAIAIGGFVIAGSPQAERVRRFDQQRTSDLQNLQQQIISYWQRKSSLPAVLTDLEDNISGFTVPADPETKAQYIYEKTGDLAFKLCANFGLPSEQDMTGRYPQSVPIGPYGEPLQNWNHGAGESCFDRTIDPQLYKPINTPDYGLKRAP
jgi:hypothetical protein